MGPDKVPRLNVLDLQVAFIWDRFPRKSLALTCMNQAKREAV